MSSLSSLSSSSHRWNRRVLHAEAASTFSMRSLRGCIPSSLSIHAHPHTPHLFRLVYAGVVACSKEMDRRKSVFGEDFWCNTDGSMWNVPAEETETETRDRDGSRSVLRLFPALSEDTTRSVERSGNEEERLSREEELARERRRQLGSGVSEIRRGEEGKEGVSRVHVHQVGGGLSFVDVWTGEARDVLPASWKAGGSDFQVSSDSRIVVFVRDGDLWCCAVPSKIEEVQEREDEALHRITGIRPPASEESSDRERLSAGVAEYIMQEEFDRYTGFWIAPQSVQQKKGIVTYRVLFFFTDERHVPSIQLAPSTASSRIADTYMYPRVGDPNADSWPAVAEIDVSEESNSIISSRVVEIERELLLSDFEWMEYTPRAGWHPSANFAWLQLLDRDQQCTAYVEIDVEKMLGNPSVQAAWNDSSCSSLREKVDSSDVYSVLYEEVSDAWINITHCPRYVPVMGGFHPSEKRIFLFSSETRNGFPNFLSIRYTQDPLTHSTVRELFVLTEFPYFSDVNSVCVQSKSSDSSEDRFGLYFLGAPFTPIERQICYVDIGLSFREPISDPHIVFSPRQYSVHSFTFDSHSECIACVLSSLDTPFEIQVLSTHTSESSSVSSLKQHYIPRLCRKSNFFDDFLRDTSNISFPIIRPHLWSFQNRMGETIHGAVFLPPHVEEFHSSPRLPLLLYIYQGPHVQLVSNSYLMILMGKMHQYAAKGFAVAMLDGHGSFGRGLNFEKPLKHRMGTFELADQIDGIQALDRLGVIDPNRVGIFGWSYGGYMSLMALAQHSDIFSFAIAGAPVTQWELYDTGYTERYLGLPSKFPDAYKKGSVLHYAHGFPNEPGRLLIVHGLSDENVHFSHTQALLSELTRVGKPYDLQVYPGERHGLRGKEAYIHSELAFADFVTRTSAIGLDPDSSL